MAKSNKERRYRHEVNFSTVLLRVLAVGIPAGIVLGGVWFITASGPQKVDLGKDVGVYQKEERLSNMRLSAENFVSKADAARKSGASSGQVAEFLRQGAEIYQDILADASRTDTDVRRLEVIRGQRDTLLSQELVSLSRGAEKLALEHEKAGRDAEALKEFQRALYFQSLVHQKFSRSEHVDNARQAELQLRINSLSAKPVRDQSMESERLAMTAMEANDWIAARTNLEAAIASQMELNRSHGNTPYASNSRLSRLESDLVSIKSGELHLAVSKKLDQAKEFEVAGKNVNAADSYQAASELQLQLNQKFPQSRFASQEKLEEFEVNRQTAMSQELATSLKKKNQSLDENLRAGRRAEYADLINDLQKNLQRLHEGFPRSRLLSSSLQQKASYLSLVLNDIDDIQKQARNLLLPAPKQTRSLSRIEVTQGFYRRVMGENPSRRKGDQLPVESVNYAQATQFCERLGWILGETVTLPTEEVFRAAVGDTAAYNNRKLWAYETANSIPQEVGTSQPNSLGFFDLLGNVSEWLLSPDSALPDAPVVNGNCAVPLSEVREGGVKPVIRTEGNRFLGFRFSVAATANP